MNIMTLSNAKVLIRTYEPYCTMIGRKGEYQSFYAGENRLLRLFGLLFGSLAQLRIMS